MEMTLADAKSALERYCAYQERCHAEVNAKLSALKIWGDEASEVVAHLIKHNFLNEERFARAFARGKHRIKSWGRMRIKAELKVRRISQYNIAAGLSEISEQEYSQTMQQLAERTWNMLRGTDPARKSKKFYDTLYRKGYESDLIYDQLQKFC